MASKNMAILFGVLAIRFAVAVVPSSDAPVRRQRLELNPRFPGQALNEDASKRNNGWTFPWQAARSEVSCTEACTSDDKPYARCEANSTYQGKGDEIKLHYTAGFSGGTSGPDDAYYKNSFSKYEDYLPFTWQDDDDEYLFITNSTDSAPNDYCGGKTSTVNRICNCGCADCKGTNLKRASTETDSKWIYNTSDGVQVASAFCIRVNIPESDSSEKKREECEKYYNVWTGDEGATWSLKQCSYDADKGDCRPTTRCCADLDDEPTCKGYCDA